MLYLYAYLQEKHQLPLAFAIMAHSDLSLLEVLLATIFRPQYSFCIFIESGADPKFYANVERLISCYTLHFPEVSLSVIQNFTPEDFTPWQLYPRYKFAPNNFTPLYFAPCNFTPGKSLPTTTSPPSNDCVFFCRLKYFCCKTDTLCTGVIFQCCKETWSAWMNFWIKLKSGITSSIWLAHHCLKNPSMKWIQSYKSCRRKNTMKA